MDKGDGVYLFFASGLVALIFCLLTIGIIPVVASIWYHPLLMEIERLVVLVTVTGIVVVSLIGIFTVAVSAIRNLIVKRRATAKN